MTAREKISRYRRHATATRRMIDRRNREHARTGETTWSLRSLDVQLRHASAAATLLNELRDADNAELARALAAETRLLSHRAITRLRGKDITALDAELTEVRRNIRHHAI